MATWRSANQVLSLRHASENDPTGGFRDRNRVLYGSRGCTPVENAIGENPTVAWRLNISKERCFSPNVQEILDNFEFRNQISKLSKADVLGTLIEKFLDSSINVGPKPVLNGDGSVKDPGLDNHAMGTIFEELVRRFNEANNEEAGEHWTPRDAVKLMAKLVFVPIADRIT